MNTPGFWQHRGMRSTCLLPLSALYALGAWLDRRFTRPRRAPLPVISVGNVTAGGAGKTPTTLALAALLQASGAQPHILTRGYGGAARTAHRVSAHDTAATVGDEALLLARAAPTWVGRDRYASALAATAAGASLLLCDDALQHHALVKTLSLLVVDGAYGLGNGRLLPAGPLREPLAAALDRTDAVVMIGPDATGLTSRLRCPVFMAALQPCGDTSNLQHGRWLAFAGLARPEKFFTSLRDLGATLAATRAFPDHYAYTPATLATLRREAEALGACLITTEKDAVKLATEDRAEVAVLPVALRFLDDTAFQSWLQARIRQRDDAV